MITQQENERLTQVGPGTPMGNLLRRYWHPVAASAELVDQPTKKVRIMGEDLVLYRDLSGKLGLIDWQCPHRKASMEYGIPEAEGLRCAYHGWLFNHQGSCLEQPAEPADSSFKDRVETKSYRVEELGGFIWGYLGPEPAPLIPRYDLLVEDRTMRQIGGALLDCNWLQIMENSVDPTHAEWLHGYYFKYVLAQRGEDLGPSGLLRKHLKIGFDVFEHGIVKRRVLEGHTEEDDDWKVGHPLVFPTILKVGGVGRNSFQFRVPVDDTHTMHYWYLCLQPPEDVDIEVPHQDVVPYYTVPFKNEDGRYLVETIDGQDVMCWVTQGAIADRTTERLGASDKGLILFRKLLAEQMANVERGEDPLGVMRDPAQNVYIKLPQEEKRIYVSGSTKFFKRWRVAYAPGIEEFMEKLETALVAKGL